MVASFFLPIREVRGKFRTWIMKRAFLFFIVITIQSCAVTKGWEVYAMQEPNGKAYLKEMEFKESFRPE